jgi:ABC-type dipeptide/oligopeptide/nickel transport system ATPase component
MADRTNICINCAQHNSVINQDGPTKGLQVVYSIHLILQLMYQVNEVTGTF